VSCRLFLKLRSRNVDNYELFILVLLLMKIFIISVNLLKESHKANELKSA